MEEKPALVFADMVTGAGKKYFYLVCIHKPIGKYLFMLIFLTMSCPRMLTRCYFICILKIKLLTNSYWILQISRYTNCFWVWKRKHNRCCWLSSRWVMRQMVRVSVLTAKPRLDSVWVWAGSSGCQEDRRTAGAPAPRPASAERVHLASNANNCVRTDTN